MDTPGKSDGCDLNDPVGPFRNVIVINGAKKEIAYEKRGQI